MSNGEPYSRKADVYSFGNLFFELLTKQMPFTNAKDNEVAELIAKGHTPRFPDNCNVPERLRKYAASSQFSSNVGSSGLTRLPNVGSPIVQAGRPLLANEPRRAAVLQEGGLLPAGHLR